MKVTRKYLMKHKTKNGAWTKSQIEALGLNFPPDKGWISTVLGSELTSQQIEVFEAKEYARCSKLSTVKKMINKLADSELIELKRWIGSK